MTKWGDGKVERICEFCGSKFLRYKAWVNGRNGRGGIYCSMKCRAKGCPKRHRKIRPHFCKECDKIFYVRKGRGGTGEYCSIQCMAIARGRMMSGKNHHNWKGGITDRPHAARIIIKRAVKEKGRCERCGSTERLHGHHKKSYADHPEFRFDKENIEVICEGCHAIEHPKLAGFIKKIPYKIKYEKVCMACGKQYRSKSEKSLFCSHKCLFSIPPAVRKKKWQKSGYKECT